jgi:hypothetical protein
MPKTLEGTRRSFHKEDVLLEQIASTYFTKRARPKSRSKPKAQSLKDVLLIFFAVGSIAAAIGFLLIVASITSSNYNEFLRKKVSALKIIPVIDAGIMNKDVVKRFEFMGYARQASSKTIKDAVILKNPRKYNWAELALPFRFPVDLSSRTLNLSIRGARGGEKVMIVAKDSENRSIVLRELYLSSNWRDESIPLSGSRSHIDLSNVSSVRIEYGRLGESSSQKDLPIESAIYIKNLNLSKET